MISFSSAQVFGIAEGERLPDYFPVDDAHPRRAARPYGLSKLLGEDLCAGFTSRTGIATVCLRPVAVWDQARYGQVRDQWRARPRSEWELARQLHHAKRHAFDDGFRVRKGGDPVGG